MAIFIFHSSKLLRRRKHRNLLTIQFCERSFLSRLKFGSVSASGVSESSFGYCSGSQRCFDVRDAKWKFYDRSEMPIISQRCHWDVWWDDYEKFKIHLDDSTIQALSFNHSNRESSSLFQNPLAVSLRQFSTPTRYCHVSQLKTLRSTGLIFSEEHNKLYNHCRWWQ